MHARPGEPVNLDDPGLDAVLQEMVRRHVVFEPTLLVYADDSARFRLGGAVARKAHQLGVTIIAGTDTLGDADAQGRTLPNLHRELALLVSMAGLSPSEALMSATRDAAKVLGADEVRGTIAAGKLADLVVLLADPLLDIRNTRSIELVIKRGRVFARH
jgi:imidazolonepropionase-like amidohydrolase